MNSTFEIIEGKLAKVNESTLPAVRSEDMEAILAEYSPHVVKAVELCALAESVKVTSETDTAWMAKAKDLRKQIASTRIEAEKARKFLKEESLRKGQIIDTIYREFEKVVKPIEKSLEESEKFAELAQAKRKEELKAKREAELAPYAVGELYKYGNLAEMSDEAFTFVLDGAIRAKREAEIAEAQEKRKAEAEAKAKAEVEAKLREENARLKAQADVDRKAREEAEAKLREAKISDRIVDMAFAEWTPLAGMVNDLVKKYGEDATYSILVRMAGTVSKQYDDEERLDCLVREENEWKKDPTVFNR